MQDQPGAAVYINSENNNILIKRTIFSNNKIGGEGYGGALSLVGAVVNIDNCTFDGNAAYRGKKGRA